MNKLMAISIVCIMITVSLFVPYGVNADTENTTAYWWTGITSTSFTFNFLPFYDSNMGAICGYGFWLGTSSSNMVFHHKVSAYWQDLDGDGVYYQISPTSTSFTGLAPSTTYYMKFAAYYNPTYRPGIDAPPLNWYLLDYCYMTQYYPFTKTTSQATSSTTPTYPSVGSCPYVSVWNGEDFELDNSLLMECDDTDFINAGLHDVEDVYTLSKAPVIDDSSGENTYKIRIQETEKYEISQINQVAFYAVDHDTDVNTYYSCESNELFTYSRGLQPSSATDNDGYNVLGMLSLEDNVSFDGDSGDFVDINFGSKDALDLTNETLKLVVTSDYKYCTYIIPISIGEMEPIGPIDVMIQNGLDSWQTIYSIYPRQRWSTDVFDIWPYLSDIQGTDVTIRLSWNSFHKVDFVGIDTSINQDCEIIELNPISIYSDDLGDLMDILCQDDNLNINLSYEKYIEAAYEVPDIQHEFRDFFVYVKGFYYSWASLDNIYIEPYQDVFLSIEVDGKPGTGIPFSLCEDNAVVSSGFIERCRGIPDTYSLAFNQVVGRDYSIKLFVDKTAGYVPMKIEITKGELQYSDIYLLGPGEFEIGLSEILSGMPSYEYHFILREKIASGYILADQHWDFADMTYSEAINPMHQFEYAGQYYITVTAEYISEDLLNPVMVSTYLILDVPT